MGTVLRAYPVHGTIASPSNETWGNTSDDQIPLGPPLLTLSQFLLGAEMVPFHASTTPGVFGAGRRSSARAASRRCPGERCW